MSSEHSLQRPDYPPFPVNPFPELPIYRIGDSDFVVDELHRFWRRHLKNPESLVRRLRRPVANYAGGEHAPASSLRPDLSTI